MVLFVWLALARGKEALTSEDPVQQFRNESSLLYQAIDTGEPVVTDDPLVFIAADFYLSDEVVGRLHFPIDFGTARSYPLQDFTDRQLAVWANEFHLRARVEQWRDFAQRNRHFLFLVNEPQRQRMYDLLVHGGWHMAVKAHDGGQTLYEISSPDNQLARSH
jgi:hypothetical protein